MNSEFRFLHLADLHLDSPFVNRDGRLRQTLADASHRALGTAIDLGLQEDVDAILLAGDLFDNAFLSVRTEAFLTEEFERATSAGITVIYVTGNHDPGNQRYRAAGVDYPEDNFHLVRSVKPVRVEIGDGEGNLKASVYCAGHGSANESTNLASGFPTVAGPEPAVGLVHAYVVGATGAEKHDRYAPCNTSDLQVKGYAYWALGHIHQRMSVNEDPPAWYPGNLQGRHFGESGPKGVHLVSISPDGLAEVEFRPVAPVRWETAQLDQLEQVDSVSALRRLATETFDRLSSDGVTVADQEWIVRFDLLGRCPLTTTLRGEEQLAELAQEFINDNGLLHAEVRDIGLSMPINLDEHRGQPHLLGAVLELIDTAKSDESILADIAPDQLAGETPDMDDQARLEYLGSLLKGLEDHAAEVLLKDPDE